MTFWPMGGNVAAAIAEAPEIVESIDENDLRRRIANELGLRFEQVGLFRQGETVTSKCHHRDGPRKIVIIIDTLIHDGRFKSSRASVESTVHKLEKTTYVIQVRHLLFKTKGTMAMLRMVKLDPHNVDLDAVKQHIAHLR